MAAKLFTFLFVSLLSTQLLLSNISDVYSIPELNNTPETIESVETEFFHCRLAKRKIRKTIIEKWNSHSKPVFERPPVVLGKVERTSFHTLTRLSSRSGLGFSLIV